MENKKTQKMLNYKFPECKQEKRCQLQVPSPLIATTPAGISQLSLDWWRVDLIARKLHPASRAGSDPIFKELREHIFTADTTSTEEAVKEEKEREKDNRYSHVNCCHDVNTARKPTVSGDICGSTSQDHSWNPHPHLQSGIRYPGA